MLNSSSMRSYLLPLWFVSIEDFRKWHKRSRGWLNKVLILFEEWCTILILSFLFDITMFCCISWTLSCRCVDLPCLIVFLFHFFILFLFFFFFCFSPLFDSVVPDLGLSLARSFYKNYDMSLNKKLNLAYAWAQALACASYVN